MIPTDEQEVEQLPPIQKDEIAEEVFAARLYAKRLTRTVVAGTEHLTGPLRPLYLRLGHPTREAHLH